MTSKRKFTTKGRAILGDRDQPGGLADILGEKKTPDQSQVSEATKPVFDDTQENYVNTDNRKTVKPESWKEDTESRKTDFTENRKHGEEEKRETVKPTNDMPEPIELPPKREEFKLPGSLAERLRVYVFDTRSKKTHVVIEALDEYLQKRDY